MGESFRAGERDGNDVIGVPVLHRVPMDGNLYEGTATLRSALRLYVEFMDSGIHTRKITP